MTRFSRIEGRWHQYFYARLDFFVEGVPVAYKAVQRYFKHHRTLKEMNQ